MSNSKSLITKFTELYEKQDMLTKLTSREFLHGYGYSEIHCIDWIGKLDNPNVTKLSSRLSMTRSAISKIIKKLVAKGAITSYKCKDNKKEIYYTLTDKGKLLFDEHHKRHCAWEERDKEFFEKLDDQDLETVNRFLTQFNKYLEEKITELNFKE